MFALALIGTLLLSGVSFYINWIFGLVVLIVLTGISVMIYLHKKPAASTTSTVTTATPPAPYKPGTFSRVFTGVWEKLITVLAIVGIGGALLYYVAIPIGSSTADWVKSFFGCGCQKKSASTISAPVLQTLGQVEELQLTVPEVKKGKLFSGDLKPGEVKTIALVKVKGSQNQKVKNLKVSGTIGLRVCDTAPCTGAWMEIHPGKTSVLTSTGRLQLMSLDDSPASYKLVGVK